MACGISEGRWFYNTNVAWLDGCLRSSMDLDMSRDRRQRDALIPMQ